MECPKCGYEREPGITHCTLCGLDFKKYEGELAEKKALKEIPENNLATEEAPPSAIKPVQAAPASSPLSSPSISKKKTSELSCPKCGFFRGESDTDCPRCGVIYEKHEDKEARQEAFQKEKEEKEAQRILEEKARVKRLAQEAIEKERQKREKTASTEVVSAKVKAGSNGLRLAGILIALTVVGALVGYFIYNKLETMKAEEAQRLLLEKQKAVQQKIEAEREKAKNYFLANKAQIMETIRNYIDKNNYEAADKELQKYEIPSLANDLQEIRAYIKEITLYNKAKKLPAAQYEANFKIYSELSELNPDNEKYQKKKKYYQNKFNKKRAQNNYRKARDYFKIKKPYRSDLQAALKAIDEAIKFGDKTRIYKNLKKKLIKAELLFYDGNDNVAMAIRDEGIMTTGSLIGQRKLYVWIKNVGQTPFYVNIEFFTLVLTNGKKLKYNDCSKSLVKNLKPGGKAKGYISFYTNKRPKELVFSHVTAGTISKKFP